MEAQANIVGNFPLDKPRKPVLESAPIVLIGPSQLCLGKTEG